MCLFGGFAFLAVLSIAASSEFLRREKRIINGQYADPELFPWMASIQGTIKPKYIFFGKSYENYCGATIISDRWLLTAAHCFEADLDNEGTTLKFTSPKLWHVRLASSKLKPSIGEKMASWINRLLNRDKMQAYYHVEKIFLHPKYKHGMLEYDIALMKLKERVPVEDLNARLFDGAPITLPTGNEGETWPRPGMTCIIVGWGCDRPGGPVRSEAHYAQLEIVEPGRCRIMYRSDINLTTSHEFCAGFYQRGVGICPGDSGSALACSKSNMGRFFLAGVTSATHSMYPESYPGIFTRVSAFMPWIRNMMRWQ